MRLFPSLLLLTVVSAGLHAQAAHRPVRAPEPTGPTAVFDTTMGRIACRLYAKEAPATVANFIDLAEGRKDWHDRLHGTVVHGTPFYDGTALTGMAAGIRGGDRLGNGEGDANGPMPQEKIPGVTFARAGRLAMAIHKGELSSSALLINTHADLELEDGRHGVVFGQCDSASIAVVDRISHALMTVDNHPEKAVAINKLTIVPPGDPMPPVAPDVDPKTVVPQPTPLLPPTLPAPEPTGPLATIDTSAGRLTCRLFKEQAPVAVSTFTELALGERAWISPKTHRPTTRPYYNGLHINRILPDFMVQQQDYPGGADDAGFRYTIETVPGLSFDRPGRLAMANRGPESNDTSWFVTDAPAHSLDDKFTIFGQCDDASVRVVHEMARVPRNAHNRPVTPITVKSVAIRP